MFIDMGIHCIKICINRQIVMSNRLTPTIVALRPNLSASVPIIKRENPAVCTSVASQLFFGFAWHTRLASSVNVKPKTLRSNTHPLEQSLRVLLELVELYR